ncbi:MAG: PIN domain-containing protein [Eggerthellaceae bacterium]|nr:PIN domain-containing protein [Eggerthellaceae bacterium]
MGKSVLCDVNIWLDFYFGDRKGHDMARRLVLQGQKQGLMFMVPASCLSDFFYICQASFKKGVLERYGAVSDEQGIAAREGAWAAMESLLRIATVVGADMSDAEIALKFKDVHRDYEDDLVIAAALRAKPDCLVTRDAKLQAKSPVLALTAEEACAYYGLDA